MTYIQIATDTMPEGTTGLAIAPWSPDEVYAVAADWSQASAPVYTYGSCGWQTCGRQVADFRHRPSAALEAELGAALIASGEDADDASDLVDDAVEIG